MQFSPDLPSASDTRDGDDAPPGAARTLVAVALILATLAIGAASGMRGWRELPQTWNEVSMIEAALEQPTPPAGVRQPTLEDDPFGQYGGNGLNRVWQSWKAQGAQRLKILDPHLYARWIFLVTALGSLVFAHAIWRRGRSLKPSGGSAIDPLSFVLPAILLGCFAVERRSDVTASKQLADGPKLIAFQDYLNGQVAAGKAARLQQTRTRFGNAVAALRKRGLSDREYGSAARDLASAVSNQGTAGMPSEEKSALRATVEALIKDNYANDIVCPPLVSALYPFGRSEAVAVTAERERTKPARVIKKGGEPASQLFMTAIEGRSVEDVRSMLEGGFDVNTIDRREGMTALHKAVALRKPEMVKLLLAQKADPNIRGASAWPLHSAVSEPSLLQLLLDAGAKADVADDNGETPLHRAAKGGQVESAKLLLQHKADPNLRNKAKRTPVDVAGDVAASRNMFVRDMLKAAGGKSGKEIDATNAGGASATMALPGEH